jgi:asparagine synthase (glutamine-hydrolysing)
MCGITGFIDFMKVTSGLVLETMTNTLLHRGPDGGNTLTIQFNEATVGLGHRRLSIIDLSESGSQPMHYKNFKITYNGEIYNYKEIKKELEELGHVFLSHSDTEVLLHAYEEWQAPCLHKLIGMFAFAIVDEVKCEVFFARDRAGVKPFYYYWKNNLFIFSSELKAFHEHPNFSKRLNHDAIALYMQYGNIPAPYTIFEDCFKIKPGHFIKLNLQNKEITETEYWNVYDNGYNLPKLKLSFNEAKEKTEAILNSAFNYRMVSDVPVGVFLSGGYDSAGLTSILQKNSSKKIQTFTIGVSDFGLDESKYAKEISQHLGTEHHEIMCTEKDALDIIIQLPYYYDEPFADSSAIPTTLVCKMAKKEVTVVLSADGGDEVFAGYNRYDYLMKYGKFLNKTPKSIRHASLLLLNQVSSEKIPYLKNRYNFHNRYSKLKNLLGDPSAENMMNSLSRQFSESDLKKLLIQDYQELKTNYSNKKLKSEYYSPLSYMMAIDYETYLPDDILQKVDRASMTSSIEAREPFLDHRLIEWAARLPNEFKYRDGVKKFILKEIVHQYIPKKMMDRPKMGFAIPLEKWLSSELKSMVFKYLDDSVIIKQGIFKIDRVNEIKKEYYQGKIENSSKLWYLLMFQMWHEKWMS